MKYLIVSTLFVLFFGNFVFSQNQSADFNTKNFREIRDKDFRNPNLTPLLPLDFAKFSGLNYFDFDKTYRVSAKLVKSDERKTFLMPTSTGGSRKYLKIGSLRFKLNVVDYFLTAFTIEYSHDHPKSKEEIKDIFVPFKDLTNGGDSYSAGRYLYARLPKDSDETILDFNLAYNPSCAYGNESFACSLPPKDNFLQVEIKAGEKRFK